MMQSFSLCYYSATAMEIPSLSEGVTLFQKYGGKIKVTARTQVQLFDKARQKAFVRDALKHHVVIISLHGGKASFPAFELLVEKLDTLAPDQRPYIHIQPTSGDGDSIEAAREFSPDFGTPDWDLIKQYLSAGGHINFHQLLVHLHNRLFATDIPCESPTPLPDDGIYHPDYPGIPNLERYLSEKIDPDKITVGLWFYQTYWVNNNLAFVDAIIRSIEAAGANVIPVFHHRYKDAERKNNGADYVVKHYFMEGDRPRIQVLINPQMFSLTLVAKEYEHLLSGLGVPFIKAMTCSAPYKQWHESMQGLPTMDVSYSAAQPEFDGALITVPVATREQETVDPVTGALLAKYHPIPERVNKMVRLTLNWGRLSRIPNSERRVAIIFHHYPPRNDRIGCAAGLDSFASVSLLMDRMLAAGYQMDHTYPDHNELSHALLEKMTCDQRWLTPDQMAARAEAHADREEYGKWHRELPQAIRDKMCDDWGAIPGDLFVHDEKMHFAGLLNGNLFLTIQPPRGYLEQIDAIYHDMYLSPPHHYLAQYRWIRDVFKADVVMHVGKHGSLEWLPGKALGLSDHCYPDLAIMELPNIYPYIINDPGEGTQAKRRSYCCIIDHLTPAFTNADLYDDLAKVQELVLQYQMAVSEDPGKVEILQPMIWEAVALADLDKDLEISEQEAMADFDRFLEKLHAYVEELGDTMINDGLHTLGLPPEGKRLTEFLVQLTRLPNGSVPSLRESLVAAMGCDYDDVLENRGVRQPHFDNKTGGEVLRLAHNQALDMVAVLEQNDFKPEAVQPLLANIPKVSRKSVETTLDYITRSLVPNIQASREEINASLDGFAGTFVSAWSFRGSHQGTG